MNDDLTTDLTRTLSDQADRVHGSSLQLADVQTKARSIRRRRTTAAVVGVVAAVALIVPTAALSSHHNDRAHDPGPATHSPTPTPTKTASDGHQPAKGVLDVSDLPTGAAPAMYYVDGGRLHFPDGGAGDLRTRYAPDQFVEMNDGSRVWHTSDNGTPYVEIQDSDGAFHDPVRSDWGLTVNPSHTAAAWLDPSGQVILWEARATDPRPLGDPVPGSDLRLGPLIGEGVGASGGSGPGCAVTACTVYVNVADGPGQPWEVSDAGTRKALDGGYLSIADLSEAGLSIGLTKATDSSTCSKLLGGGEFQGFSTCQNQLTSFSPDGRLILALPSYFDGVGPGGIAMYDLDGTRLFERTSTEQAQSYFTGATWEDDTHVLAPAYQDGKWALVRIGSDGSMEYAVAPATGPYDQSPFVLPTTSILALTN
ncbi:MAG: hypothetical protein ACR2K3_06895 [Nocardioides sp.]